MASSRRHQAIIDSHTPHHFHDSKSSIHRVAPEILYYVFKSAVFVSSTPARTALNISHVCRYWRGIALASPMLWKFIDLDMSRSLVDLILSRSGIVPLTMSWTYQPYQPSVHPNCKNYVPPTFLPSKGYPRCIAHPENVLPRVDSLNLHVACHELRRFYWDVGGGVKIAPLQLRRLVLRVYSNAFPSEEPEKLLVADIVPAQVDPAYLQELILEKVDLTGFEIPSNNKLTHFNLIHPLNPPSLSCILRLLSTCSSLCDLQLHLHELKAGENELDTTNSDPTTQLPTDLSFPKLKRLSLQAWNAAGYLYMREITARIRIVSPLSQLHIDWCHCRDIVSLSDEIYDTTRHNIFEAIPSGALSSFVGHECLELFVINGVLNIGTGPRYPNLFVEDYPFRFMSPIPSASDHLAQIVDMTRAMRVITDLVLIHRAWELPWVSDIPNLFPCLETLRLGYMSKSDDIVFALSLLPASLKLRRLVLLHPTVESISSSIGSILNTIPKTGAETLELNGVGFEDDQIRILKTRLNEKGVELVRYNIYKCDCVDCADDH